MTDSVGLGLTISRQLASLMGGDLGYFHEDGWSIFRVSLPEAADPALAVDEVEARSA